MTDQNVKPVYALLGFGDAVVAEARRLPERLSALPGIVPAIPRQLAGEYDELAQRGASLAGRIQRQAASRRLVGDTRNTLRTAERFTEGAKDVVRDAGEAARAGAEKAGTTTLTAPASEAPKAQKTARATAKKSAPKAVKPK